PGRGLLRLPGGPRGPGGRLRHPLPACHDRAALRAERRSHLGGRAEDGRVLMTSRDFLLPDLGEGLEEAEIVKWLVAEGEQIALNQPLVEVNTAKALVEIPSPFAGKVTKLHGADGEVVFVGKPLVTIEVEGA